ncbi:MAG: hypothetical protein ABIE74_01935 [Pseudomonadota bacterium]
MINTPTSHLWQQHYGFFNPTQNVQRISNEQARQYMSLLERPIHTSAQALRLMKMTANILPSYEQVINALKPDGSSIEVTKFPMVAGADTEHGKVMIFPKGENLHSQYMLTGFLRSSAFLLQAVETPPISSSNNSSQIFDSLWRRYTWEVACHQSFLYQMEFEMRRAGLSLHSLETPGILEPIDWALYGLFKQRGLAGIADVYQNYQSPALHMTMSQHFEKVTKEFLTGASNIHRSDTWEKPNQRDKPLWIQNELDEKGTFYAKYNWGLLTKESIDQRLSQEELREIERLMNKTVNREEDIETARRLFQHLAPKLAAWLLDILDQSQIKIRMSQEKLMQPVISTAFEAIFLGGTEAEATIYISPGYKMRELVSALVASIANYAIPADFSDFFHITRETVSQLTKQLMQHYIRSEAWGYSARFEFYHQAKERGLNLEEENPGLRKVKRFMEKAGIWAFCQHYESFADPHQYKFMKAQFRQIAKSFLENSI